MAFAVVDVWEGLAIEQAIAAGGAGAGLAAALYLDRHWSQVTFPTLLAPFPVLMALLGLFI